ncbi:MAG TPA: ATP-binding protein [Opitutaceae bacterium]|nr:ATP-binding protein [Opitutaceae bacterium]
MKLDILHLEDNPQDAELIHAMLQEEWPECVITTVDSRATFLAEVEREHDLILSDFTLPGFDGLEALKLTKQVRPDRPFIFVSGSIGEERAIEAVRHGAFDYVIKDRMRRLTMSIRRAMNERHELQRRRAAEDAHNRLVSILERTPAFVAIMTERGSLSYLNPSGRKLIGLPPEREPAELTLQGLHTPEAAARFVAECLPSAIRSGSWLGESSLLTLDGRRLPVSELLVVHKRADGGVDYVSSVMHDLTEKKKLEEQFLRAQRVETIGMLASGIAHDLNNVLAPIAMSAPLLRQRTTNPADVKLLDALEKSAERGTGLVRQILNFARGSTGEMGPLPLRPIVRDVVAVVKETFPKDIEFAPAIADELPLVHGHPSQIHQVLLNLCVNARDAMPEGGRLSLNAGVRALGAPEAERIPGGRPGTFVVLEVADSGTGIPPEALAHIWEPFFTTKDADRGTGLGLSTVRGIVDNHNGFIDLHTCVGQGTSFSIYLPVLKP